MLIFMSEGPLVLRSHQLGVNIILLACKSSYMHILLSFVFHMYSMTIKYDVLTPSLLRFTKNVRDLETITRALLSQHTPMFFYCYCSLGYQDVSLKR